MKKNNRVPKKLLKEMLDILGLTFKRVTYMDNRMWLVEGGDKPEYHPTLKSIFMVHKNPKTKDKQQKISNIVQKINRSIH